jgi:hypothetical protein
VGGSLEDKKMIEALQKENEELKKRVRYSSRVAISSLFPLQGCRVLGYPPIDIS